MTLNKREQLIAWTVGGVIGLWVLYLIVNSVFFANVSSMQAQLLKENSQYKNDSQLLDRATVVKDKWEKLGILTSPAAMGQQVHTAVTTFAQQTGVTISNWVANTVTRPVTKTDYEEATFKAHPKGNSAGFSRFLYSLENSRTPMRVDEMAIASQPPGQDVLAVNLTLTALIYAPKPVKGAASQPASKSTSTKPAATKPASGLSAGKERDIETRMEAERQKQLSAPGTGPAGGAETTQPASAPATGGAAAPTTEDLETRMARQRQQQLDMLSTPATAPATAPTGGAQ